jgi:putative DNA primase/helicase
MAKEATRNGIDWSASYITPEWIERAGIFRVDHQAGAELVGRRPKAGQHYQGVVIPYFWPGEDHPREYRLRRDIPDYEEKADGTRQERNKYLSPPGRGNMVYFPPGTDPAWLDDPAVETIITEGEKKALALARYFTERGEKTLIMALPGVWNFRGKVGVERGPQGERVTVKGLIADLRRIAWRGRQVKILFDANAITNTSVNAARRELARELVRLGATARLLDLEPMEGVNGVDDFLGKQGPDAFAKFLAEAEEGRNLHGVAAFPLTDVGNAERLIARRGEDLRWYDDGKKWYVWDGLRWRRDELLQVERWAKEVIRAIPEVEGMTTDDGESLFAYSRKCESNDKIKSMLARARAEEGVPVRVDGFDADHFLLNCSNGTLDLRTGELRPHSRDDLITKLCPIAYDPDAKAERWERFLDEIFNGDRSLIDFIWQAVGYSLTGDISAQCIFVLYGAGSNGKSVLINIVRDLLGEYGEHAAIETFMTRQQSGIPNDLARLRGSRIVTATETNEGHRLNESLIKQVTGGEPITARFLREEFFTYQPQFKLWFSVNCKPTITGTDYGLWRRVRLIPFEVRFPEGDPRRDDRLPEKLEAELPGILAWAVRGCHDWLENGFRIPQAVRLATEEYQRESDVVGLFISDCCVVKPEATVRAGELYKAYVSWAEEQGMRPISSTLFGKRLSAKGFQADHDFCGKIRVGIGLLSEQAYATN